MGLLLLIPLAMLIAILVAGFIATKIYSLLDDKTTTQAKVVMILIFFAVLAVILAACWFLVITKITFPALLFN